ncbi:MarR family winged helix-turn-helix transcriptional regulator [Lentilactobacillus parakefiri]|uniref:MarR family transcriptional regulator n=1 Tax=Lentilactobacillus parakefiri TaxID=152332 RepID=A0A269YCZ2_9LACO|nr:winged helix DNA-binding protein [Lentilactobacillus parakefiri]PAK83071.1 MarR family transcriptional regulator [Lentilactobacillus parakefiri]PAL00088.1 MarR family transcriptional regulator [Lentilactobacillus parakefiri]TDG89939.1 hypothetical protein C5L28_001261 [Lentilactobacillus parakefiri]GAW71922.1 MarR family transcriptional regulator [Lentilactobacillus parakefiri]
MKKKNAIEQIKEQLEVFRSHDVDDDILTAIKAHAQLDPKLIAGLTINDLHILRAVGHSDGVKISAIVDQVPLTQGAVSKAVNKLTTKGLVHKFHQAGNRKDNFVALTAVGSVINQIHTDYHHREEALLQELAANYSKNDLETIAAFVSKLNQIRKNNYL